MLPIWQHIPDFIKKKVVNKLDFKSRICLERCSTAERALVSHCPLKLDKLVYGVYPGGNHYMEIDDQLLVIWPSLTSSFLWILNHFESETRELELRNVPREVLNELVADPWNFPVQKFSWENTEAPGGEFIDFLTLLPADHLKSLRIREAYNPNVLERLFVFLQSRSLEELSVSSSYALAFNSFREFCNPNLKMLEISVPSYTADQIWSIIEFFKSREAGSNQKSPKFIVRAHYRVSVREIIDRFEVELRNEPIFTDRRERMCHVQRFAIAGCPDKLLIVNVGLEQVKGAIVRKSHMQEDFIFDN